MNLDGKIFKKGIEQLEFAFRINPCSKNTLAIYYKKLSGVSDKTFQIAVEEIIDREDFFPSIATLRRYCGEGRLDASGQVLQVIR